LWAHSETPAYLVGTNSVRNSNEIHLILYDEEKRDISCGGIYNHPTQLNSLSTCPINRDGYKELFCATYGPGLLKKY